MQDEYFKEIEDRFRELRGTPSFMMGTSDWSLVSKWRGQGIPLACVIWGLDEAFRSHAARRTRDTINSVAYCTAQVLDAWKQHRKATAA